MSYISETLNNVYREKIERPAVENPIVAVITSVATKVIFSPLLSFFSPLLGLLSFLGSFVIEYALVSNLEKTIENTAADINALFSERGRGQRQGAQARRQINVLADRATGFFEGLFA